MVPGVRTSLLPLRRARSIALLALLLTGYGFAAGCSGRTNRTPESEPPGGTAQTGGEPSEAQAAQGGDDTLSGGTSPGGGGHVGSAGHGGASGGGGHGGASGGGGKAATAGAGGSSGASGASGGSGVSGTAGGSGGIPACGSAGCGFACFVDGFSYAPGDILSEDCNQCFCQLSGIVSCETKDCDKDCPYLSDQYIGAYLEAQDCTQGPVPDPCTRVQSASLDCDCPSPVSTSQEFLGYSLAWAQKWTAAGCKDPNQQCPPCPPVGMAYCDTAQGICRYK